MTYKEYTLRLKSTGEKMRAIGRDPIEALRALAFVFGCEIEPPFDRISNWDVVGVKEEA